MLKMGGLPPSYNYPGLELQLFLRARHWRAYWAKKIQPYLSGSILEVGAGIGAPAQLLQDERYTQWLCLEPDEGQFEQIQQKKAAGVLLDNVKVQLGNLSDLTLSEKFNSILYIDVLEHIEQDLLELEKAYSYLLPGGYLIVLAPAHPILYTSFDAAIGHFRRYNLNMLRAIRPKGATISKAIYLDSFGMLASLANKLLLRSAAPTPAQILLWDSVLVPLSKVFDQIFCWRIGKSVLCVFERPPIANQ